MSVIAPFLSRAFSIALIDLTLSGDNAAVIGLAIRNLDKNRAKRAAILGASLAILLRLMFTIIATWLTRIPYLRAFGALLLIFITWKLMVQDEGKDEKECKNNGFWGAVWSIVVADISMAFDNVLAVAGAAEGSTFLVIFGLALSIPLLIWGSTFIANMMQRFPIVMFLGAAILAKTAVGMLLSDTALDLERYISGSGATIIEWAALFGVMVYGAIVIKQRSVAVSEMKS